MSGPSEMEGHREYLDGCEKRAKSQYQAMREVVRAARELTHWEWLHLLDDSVHSREVRTDVARLRDALAKLDGGEG